MLERKAKINFQILSITHLKSKSDQSNMYSQSQSCDLSELDFKQVIGQVIKK